MPDRWRWPELALSVGARGAGAQPDAAFAFIGQPRAQSAQPMCAVTTYADGQACGEGAMACESGE